MKLSKKAKAAYKKVVKKYKIEFSSNKEYLWGYYLVDMNGDKKAELLVQHGQEQVLRFYEELTEEQIKESGFDKYYVDHTLALWPQAAGGIPFNACEFQSKGDVITDLTEDLAAEQKARTTYDNILRLVKDPDVADPIRFLRAREIVHFQRFGEALRITQDNLDSKNFYAFNPAFD